MKTLANALSYLLHPTFIPLIAALLLHYFCPNLFSKIDAKNWQLIAIQIGFNFTLYPIVAVFLMLKLQFIKSLQLSTNTERFGPLIATMVFYCWGFYTLHKNLSFPRELSGFYLGTFISICILFFTTLFTKMSMHTTGIAGLLSFVTILFMAQITCVTLQMVLVILIITLLVIWSRLYLKAHTKAEIVSGLLIGSISQIIAWFLYTH
jgi:membrane-associated phospholipid phosphatase